VFAEIKPPGPAIVIGSVILPGYFLEGFADTCIDYCYIDIDTIVNVKRGPKNGMNDVPIEPVIILSAKRM
jgi:hypothetical protein